MQPLKARLAELLDRADGLEKLKNAVGIVNPRLPGWRNDFIQYVKTLIARALAWYTRPLYEFNTSVSRSLEEMASAMVVLQTRLAQSEKRNEALAQLMQEQLKTLNSLQQAAMLESAAGMNSRPCIDTSPASERTAYVIGLFGSGRQYVGELIQRNIGERANYFRDRIRLHPGPTPMIYSGHATLRHVSRGQNLPEVTNRVLEAVRAGFADLIFVYRHPLDSLLTNWIWWRTHIRDERCISGISQIYEKTEDLCADLERNFTEFRAFAAGDPDFFAGAPRGPRFLSFLEFVEETDLYLQSDATVKLRLEDFMIDPLGQFSRIVDVMSVDLDWSGVNVPAPRSKPYGYLAVKEKVPRFENFIDGLDAETKRRMEKIGYAC
jgi:hypothetical protein